MNDEVKIEVVAPTEAELQALAEAAMEKAKAQAALEAEAQAAPTVLEIHQAHDQEAALELEALENPAEAESPADAAVVTASPVEVETPVVVEELAPVKTELEIQQAEADAAVQASLQAAIEAEEARKKADEAQVLAEKEAAEAEEAKTQAAIEAAEAEEAAKNAVMGKVVNKIAYSDIAFLYGGLDGVNAALSNFKTVSVIHKPQAAELLVLHVRDLVAIQTQVIHKLFAEIERIKREGFANG